MFSEGIKSNINMPVCFNTMEVLLLVPFLFLLVSSEKIPRVDLPSLGQIEGFNRKSFKGHTFNAFEGVPYAQPPINEKRFEEPLPVLPWVGTLKARTMYKCMQYNQYTLPGQDYVVGDEDCLYLNIYTRSLNPNANLDVIVYIHGGAFMFNWGGYQRPDYLLDRDVVVISFNYRLGPLGFLSTENKLVPGNNGMRDQILALQFIKKYVQHFGGNPNSITTMGMSAGGASVHFHYLSPKSRNLYNRGISQSGTTLCPWVLQENALDKAKKLGSNLGCDSTDLEKMVKCLKVRSARQIVQSVKDFQPWIYTPFSPFGLVVDKWSTDPVLPDHPYVLIKNGQVNDVPWIASYTNSEGLYPSADFYIDEKNLLEIEDKWYDLLPHLLDFNYTVNPKLHDQVSKKIKDHYLKDKKVSKHTFQKYVDVVSDRIFVIDIQKTARWQAAVTKSPIWSYYFTYRGAHSWSEARAGSTEDFGASHGDDTAYVFKFADVDTTSTAEDRKMIDFFLDFITSYAQTGKPQVPIDWEPLSKASKDEFRFLQIDGPDRYTLGSGVSPNMAFWDSLPIIENEKLFKSSNDEL